MDIIDDLPDDILLKILSLVPLKTAFDAQLLSKRWRKLWRRLSILNFDRAFHKSDISFKLFMHTTITFLEYPVIESLNVRSAPTEISHGLLVMNDLLVNRVLRKVDVFSAHRDRSILSYYIYTYQTLVILKLENLILEDNYQNYFRIDITLPSLKVLQLIRVKYPSDEFLSRLLSSLQSLEDLILDRCLSDKPGTTTTLAILVPSLKRLRFVTCPDYCRHNVMMLNVNTPCLNFLSIEEYWRNVSFADRKMEELVEADVNVIFINTKKLLRTLISAKRLSLCLVTSKIPHGDVVFDQLVRLEICTCQKEWWNLLERVLLDSPKLRFLKLHQKHRFGIMDPVARWEEPSVFPDCFVFHLETFEWRGYEGTQEEQKIVSYILRNTWRLKTATINIHPEVSLMMIMELLAMPKASTSCQLVIQYINDPWK
ncbi:F-box/FBD/LRR-repeat protein [Cardamine amara subsp. amara]|uniref:F-box/FBD/LRR-repeat protein n=1 Tax=Cardamine amara subsp. amara TaxID=228776 RepID=A0ABD1BJS2_CARAN